MHHTTPTRRSAGGPARISIPAAIALVVALATTLLAAMPFAGPPQGAAAFAAKGPMVHVSERNIDFGNVEQFQQLEKVIRISNIGDAPLLLLKIDTDCGCTTGIPADSVIAPGRSTPLRISFATRESKGITEKKVTILTNDPAESKVTISLVADIRPLVEMTPERVRFEPLRAGETATQTVRLRAEKGFGLKVTGIDASERFLHVTSRAVPSADAEVIEIVVQVKPDAPAGPFRDDVEVHTLSLIHISEPTRQR
ncbi:MAG: DUF1573 domain-containing protein, partial [Candidatus Eisenbacteria bacterium]|nr:DUF1573 domain-containing protein [Candidatus Eisenbacteria bacterium]